MNKLTLIASILLLVKLDYSDLILMSERTILFKNQKGKCLSESFINQYQLSVIKMSSRLRCNDHCSKLYNCRSILYNSYNLTCQLFSSEPNSIGDMIENYNQQHVFFIRSPGRSYFN